MALDTAKRGSRKFGWRSGKLRARSLEITDGQSVLGGRISTLTVAGSAVDINAAYTWGEGIELRYSVSDWTGVGSSFRGMYLRAENGVAGASKNIYGMELFGVANNVNTGSVWGALAYAYIKGTAAKTVGPAYGIQAELSFDAGSSTNTITTEASAGFFRITGGVADSYTKLHGIILRAGDMDGASRTYGNGITIEDGPEAGAITWTNAINISSLATNVITVAGVHTSLIRITGAGTNLLSFDAVEGAISGTPGTLTATHKIAINIDGVGTRYIHCGTTA